VLGVQRLERLAAPHGVLRGGFPGDLALPAVSGRRRISSPEDEDRDEDPRQEKGSSRDEDQGARPLTRRALHRSGAGGLGLGGRGGGWGAERAAGRAVVAFVLGVRGAADEVVVAQFLAAVDAVHDL